MVFLKVIHYKTISLWWLRVHKIQDTQRYNFYIIISLAKLISKEKSDLNGILCIVFLSNKCWQCRNHGAAMRQLMRARNQWCSPIFGDRRDWLTRRSVRSSCMMFKIDIPLEFEFSTYVVVPRQQRKIRSLDYLLASSACVCVWVRSGESSSQLGSFFGGNVDVRCLELGSVSELLLFIFLRAKSFIRFCQYIVTSQYFAFSTTSVWQWIAKHCLRKWLATCTACCGG